MTTSIVILNWNGRDFLKKYLPCLLGSVKDYEGVEVVVADNASNDDSLEVLRAEFPEVKTIVLDKNYGFAAGYNKALSTLQSDFYLLLNSDVQTEGDWLSPLLEWMDFHPDCGVCAPLLKQVVDHGKFEYAGAAGGYIDRFCFPFCRGRVMNRVEEDHGQYDCPEEVMWVSGAALLIRAEVFHLLGGFCGDFFAHMEEIDLCWRARLEGWKIHVVPRSVVYHVGGGTLAQNSPFKLFLNYRNNLLMMSRCLPRTLAIYYAYTLISNSVLPDEGPDMIHNCNEIYNKEYDKDLQQEILSNSVEMGIAQTKWLLIKRLAIDNLAAAVYLLTFRFKDFKAVRNAHREFLQMRNDTSRKDIIKYLKAILSTERDDIARLMLTDELDNDNYGGEAFKIKGIWSKWVVWQGIFKKGSIFAEIKDNIR